jgi:RimJ/RimL family protein N-acetyltransferase
VRRRPGPPLSVVLRAVEPDDRDGLISLYTRASAHSLRLRFFDGNLRTALVYLNHVFDTPDTDWHAIIAVVDDAPIGVAEYERCDPDMAEIAFFVDDAWQRLGIGTRLLNRLVRWAGHDGIRTLEADVLTENTAALSLLHGTGLISRVELYGDTRHLRLDLPREPNGPCRRRIRDRIPPYRETRAFPR